ncbi:hypothetical protein HYPSUDRAFT_1045692 [Hypholoma sublateritium FD-334 SS-4]|uniref:Uncharacterized protein n=1 Tax=Hypholoma sublateritium (strain FD-334 SS-4) TaxID=945553 RepID=A0A0D2P9F3_HYPSF|nr:hypothetical protein HYPSUDRAFT_1045692 [Hypholoma sublateritium FD-334 SS-4]
MLGRHPEQQLKIVRGLLPRGALTPFAQLDALYRHIFSQVQDLEVTSLILTFVMLSHSSFPDEFPEFLGLQTVDIYVALAPLQSVIDCTSGNNIEFLHASLPDFLLDKERSQEYYINRSAWSTRLSVMAYKFVMSVGYRGYIPFDMYLTDAEATAELRRHVIAFDPDKIENLISADFSYYIICVQRLDFGDGPGGIIYQQQLNVIVRYASKKHPDSLETLRRHHNISEILSQIEGQSVPLADSDTAEEQDQLESMEAAYDKPKGILEATRDWQESAAANKEQREIKNYPLARKIFRGIWKSEDRSTETREWGIRRDSEEWGASSTARPKLGLSRLFRK